MLGHRSLTACCGVGNCAIFTVVDFSNQAGTLGTEDRVLISEVSSFKGCI